jgi:hypothetical protein
MLVDGYRRRTDHTWAAYYEMSFKKMRVDVTIVIVFCGSFLQYWI